MTRARPMLTFPKTPALPRATVRAATVYALDASRERPARETAALPAVERPVNERATTW